MPRTFVPHPETGQPVEARTEYVEASRDELVQAVESASNELDAAQTRVSDLEAQVEAARQELAAKEAAHEDAKSSLGGFDAIAPQPQPDVQSEGVDAEASVAEAGEVAEPTPEPAPEQPVF